MSQGFRKTFGGIVDFPGQSRARAYLSGDLQSIPNLEVTKVEFDAETYDEQNEFDKDTHHRFTASRAGYYSVVGSVYFESCVADKYYNVYIFRNANATTSTLYHSSTASGLMIISMDILYLDANDFVELKAYHNSGVAKNLYNRSYGTFIAIHKLS